MRNKHMIAVAILLSALTALSGTALSAKGKNLPASGGMGVPVGLAAPSAPSDAVAGASYVGSAACKACHAKEHEAWAVSGHANMLRPFSPGIITADFSGALITYEGVEVEDADKNKVKINPSVKTETRDGVFYVTLLDTDNPANTQSYEVVEVLGGLWEQQYYIKAGDKLFPSPVRWVESDRQWRKAPFAPFWWAPDGTPDGRPKRPEELPAKQTVDYQCNGCHTTAFSASKDGQGKHAFSRVEGGIGCEQCHGPASRHVAAQGQGAILNPRKLGTVQQEQLCGQCHSRVTSKQDKDFAFPLGFKPGQTDLQDRVEFWTYSTRPGNFWGNEDARKNRQQYHDTWRSGHMASGVTCSSCHLDHTPTHQKGSLRQPREQQCIACHTAQKAMFEGSVHARNGVVCVDCHMSKMGNRAGATKNTPKEPWDVSAHTMRVITPVEADPFRMRSSCDKCHQDAARSAKGAQLLNTRENIQKSIRDLQAMKTTSSKRDMLLQVLLDGSLGAHNPQKAVQLLQANK